MRHLYTLLLSCALPVALLRLYLRGIRAPAYRERWRERLGCFPAPSQQGGIWVHAVSVGEVRAVVPLIKRLLQQRPGMALTVTTTTPTGSAEVRRQFGDRVFHVYFPYDLPPVLRAFLDRIEPEMLLMVETEIWPNLLWACKERGISTLLANARLSARSARRYGWLRGFSRATFGHITRIAAQAKADAGRFVSLGAAAERVLVTGSIKFDFELPASLAERSEVVRRSWAGRPVWIAASTHDGEEQLLLRVQKRLMRRDPKTLLVLVPRHPERFDRVFDLCKQERLTVARRSSGATVTEATGVYLLDTMGELPVYLGAADIAFFGGSLVPVGGHNMLEAAAQGVPVIFGPHWFNFQSIGEMLLKRDGARQIAHADDLFEALIDWFSDASRRARVGENARQVVEANRGALTALEAVVDELLPM